MLTTGDTCAAPGEGAESGEQPEEPPNRLEMKTGPERPDVSPKRQNGRNGREDRQIDRLDRAVRTLCTSCCICRKTQVQQQQQQQQQQQRRGLCSSHSTAVAVEATTGVFKLKETVTMNELLFTVVHLSLVVVMLSMCSPGESIVYDSHWSSFAVLCLVHFVGSLVWPHRFRHRILHYSARQKDYIT